MHRFPFPPVAAPPEHRQAWAALVSQVLVPLCALSPCPLVLSSGYRSAAHNALVGGKSTSQHLRGEAADLVPACKAGAWLANLAVASDRFIAAAIPFDQFILELPLSPGRHPWIHVSLRLHGQQRGQLLTGLGPVRARTYLGGIHPNAVSTRG